VRIYADFNGLVAGVVDTSRTAVVLDTFGSLRDLSNAGVVLTRGLPLIAYDESDESEDLEGHGTAQYDHNRAWWVVEFDEQGVRYVPARERSRSSEFRCVKCGSSLAGGANNNVWREDLVCTECGTQAVAAIAPPPAT
jgi:DNA-directed RNA polymerase subunit RPC12/RpoP